MKIWVLQKRLWKKPSFWTLIVLICISPYMINQFNNQMNQHKIKVGYSMEALNSADYMSQIEENLKLTDSPYEFMRYDTDVRLKKAVMTNEVNCGYSFTDGIEQAFLNGNFHGMIESYYGTGIQINELVNERIFAVCFQIYCNQQIMENQKIDENQDMRNQVTKDLFRVEYEYLDVDKTVDDNKSNTDVMSVNTLNYGEIAIILIALLAVLGGSQVINDYRSQYFTGMKNWGTIACIEIMLPIMWGISCALLIAGFN